MGDTRARRMARGLLIAFYAIAGIGHLVFVEAVVRIVPRFVPAPRAVVIVTGLCELAGAVGLMLPRWRRAAGWALAAYALCVWPANVQHAITDLTHGTGLPIWYHLPRLAFQPVIIWWALWAAGILPHRHPRAGEASLARS